MKHVGCLMLILVLLISSVSGFCEGADGNSDFTEFNATLTNAVDRQAKEWIADEDMRAVASVLLVGDLIVALNRGDEADLTIDCFAENSYIGKNELDLVLYVHGYEYDYTIFYRPLTGEAAYGKKSPLADTIIETMYEDLCVDGFYKNDKESLYTALELLYATLAGNN